MEKINLQLLLAVSLTVLFFVSKTKARNSPQRAPPFPARFQTKKPRNFPTEKHQLTVFYEVLDPNSRNFISQLEPVYKDLKDFIQLEFVPYGLTKLHCGNFINDECKLPGFICQHGPEGCRANHLHVCVLKHSNNTNNALNFVFCTMGKTKTTTDECLSITGISSKIIENCIASKEGMNLQLKFRKRTSVYKIQKLPALVFDGRFSQEFQDSAIKNLGFILCSLMAKKYKYFNSNNAPKICFKKDIFLAN